MRQNKLSELEAAFVNALTDDDNDTATAWPIAWGETLVSEFRRLLSTATDLGYEDEDREATLEMLVIVERMFERLRATVEKATLRSRENRRGKLVYTKHGDYARFYLDGVYLESAILSPLDSRPLQVIAAIRRFAPEYSTLKAAMELWNNRELVDRVDEAARL